MDCVFLLIAHWTTGRSNELMTPSYGLLGRTVYGRQEFPGGVARGLVSPLHRPACSRGSCTDVSPAVHGRVKATISMPVGIGG
jgi:hypothetical protein